MDSHNPIPHRGTEGALSAQPAEWRRSVVPKMPAAARILVVDDERALMKALCETLEAEGYEPVGFTSASDAVAALREEPFDLLLTDLMMPGMDGIALIRAAMGVDPNLVCLLITGHGTIGTAVDAMQSGALDYILKPFKASALLPAVARGMAVRRLRQEKTVLERGLSDRTKELQAANQELEALAYSVAHDLRAPLAAITGFSAVMADRVTVLSECRVRELAGRVHANAVHMGTLFDDLIKLSRTSRAELRRSDVDLSAMAETIVADLRSAEPSRTVRLSIEPGIRVQGDAGLLRVAFENLLGNAWKYTNKRVDSHIELRSERDAQGELVLAIRDNGVGFDMAYAQSLFKPFRRLHGAGEFPGTGIGLSIVRRVVERHGGRIWAEATEGLGACFRLTLPLPFGRSPPGMWAESMPGDLG
jgi:signal transduction histidine kinase